MKFHPLLRRAVQMHRLALAITIASFTITGYAQGNTSVLKVIKPQISEAWTANLPASEKEVMKAAPAKFFHLGVANVGGNANIQRINIEFTKSATLTKIESPAEFSVQQESSCAVGRHYQEGSSCSLVVKFAPKGPGHRVGRIKISQDQSNLVENLGLGGYGYAPVITFIPSLITTVPNTYPSNVGLLNGAQNLGMMGDTLLIADTGNNLVRVIDSSGVPQTVASGFSAPWGITSDSFGQIYFSRPAANALHEIYDYGPVVQINGAGTGGCPASTPCTLSSHTITKPGEMSMDPYDRMFFTEQTSGGAFSAVQPVPANLIFLYDPFPYQTVTQGPAAMDAGDNIYSFWTTSGNCELVQQSLYNAENSNVAFYKVAGGHTCGFTGDGGLATNAQIGSSVGQITFDLAGNLYFTDTSNQRVRRIDYNTGVIRTIAGNGTAGYTGDGGSAKAATLNTPTGLAVDSQGAVYIISNSASTGTEQVIRKVGPRGVVTFPNQSKGTSSSTQFVTVTNTGNTTMVLSNYALTGTNAANFKFDLTTTTCVLTAGATLGSGQTCRIGFIFTPSGTGLRTAQLTLLDNTISGSDVVVLKGNGTLPVPTFKITSPANNASFVSGSAVPFAVSVTSTSGPQPTGKIQFKVDGANYGAAVTLSNTGTASTSVTGLTTTTHKLSATYSGDANYAAAGPVSVSITITAAAVRFSAPVDSGKQLNGSAGNRLQLQ